MGKGYGWAVSAGLNAALSAIAAKYFYNLFIRYGMVLVFNLIMWGCYVNSLNALSSLQATVTNFATNFLSSKLAGFVLFDEDLSGQPINKLQTLVIPRHETAKEFNYSLGFHCCLSVGSNGIED